MSSLVRVARFLRGYLRSSGSVGAQEIAVPFGRRTVEATLYAPPRRRPLPPWIVLHGGTVLGRRHESLTRFARALAAAGNAVVVPEVPAWTQLRIETAAAAEAIAAGSACLTGRREARDEPARVVGFSVGATQGLIAAADAQIAPLVRAVIGFGGYADLHRTMRCMCAGEYELGGELRRLEPDPYGRWIVAANHIADVPEYRGNQRLAEGFRHLAMAAGRRGIMAYDASFDRLKAEIRETLPAADRHVWDVLAHPTAVQPDLEAARRIADQLADAALAADPTLDPLPALARLDATVVLAHGRQDRLIPFTESMHLHRALPPAARASLTITDLFAHSVGSGGLGALRYAVEALRFVGLMRRALG